MGCAGADELVPVASAKGSDDAGRMKFLCSHGGKILPKPDGQLRYVGGDTRLVSFNKSINFSDLSCKLEKLFGPNLCIKYQLPNEDLDTLISVTCDDDVENLVEEYDKNEAKDGASRLRAFLFSKAGVPVRDVLPCACHAIDEAKSLGEQKMFDLGSTSPIPVSDCRCLSSAMFQMPDYLSGMESGCSGHGCRQQHHLDGDNQLSPRCLVDEKGSTMKFVRPISPSALQKEYSRQQSSKLIDSGGRGPALTTSALGPLVSNHHQLSWDRRKRWDEAIINQRGDEKWQIDASNEGNHYNQQDVVNGVSMVRVSSKDRLAPSFIDVVAVDSPSGFDRQPRPHVIPRSDLHSDIMEDGRPDGHFQGSARLYKPPDAQRVVPEMQWGLPQSAATVYHAASADSRRNSGDSDEGSHKAHSGADSGPLALPVVIAPEGPHGLKMQEAYRHEEPIVIQQGRHGEYEVSASQYEPFHHLSKGHFQQVHWQLHDPQEPQQHPIAAPLESVRVVHNNHGMQRPGQSHEYLSPSVAHHHHLFCASNNTRVVPRSDASTVSRLPSPLYRQAASASVSRTDPPSPRRGQVLNTGSPFTSRQGVRVIQKHDMNYLPSSKAQHSSGLPSSQVFINAMEQHGLYEQSGSQAHLAEKGSLSKLEPQAQYFDNAILTNQEGAVGQAHGADDELQYGCMSSNHELQGVSS